MLKFKTALQKYAFEHLLEIDDAQTVAYVPGSENRPNKTMVSMVIGRWLDVFDKEPTWLVSYSRWKLNIIDKKLTLIPTDEWSDLDKYNTIIDLRKELKPVGNKNIEWVFRLPSVLYLFRKCSQEEINNLTWRNNHIEFSGPPLEILEYKGIEPPLTIQPCQYAEIKLLDGSQNKIISECENCLSCRARKKAKEFYDGLIQ